jgi:hypothetical protein
MRFSMTRRVTRLITDGLGLVQSFRSIGLWRVPPAVPDAGLAAGRVRNGRRNRRDAAWQGR